MVDKVEALDKYTVKFTLKEPNAWFVDLLASTSTWIIAKECVEQYGDLKKAERVVGTGPWMLERYEPNVRIDVRPQPELLRARVALRGRRRDARSTRIPPPPSPPGSPASTTSAPSTACVRRQRPRRRARRGKPGLQTRGLHRGVSAASPAMKLDQEPFKDVRVRRALAHAPATGARCSRPTRGRRAQGAPNPLIPAALKEWAIPIDQLPAEGRKLYELDTAEAKRLLAEAGHPNGLQDPGRDARPGYGPDCDGRGPGRRCKNWKAAGIDADLKLKEYGAFISSTHLRQVRQDDARACAAARTDPDTYFYRRSCPASR